MLSNPLGVDIDSLPFLPLCEVGRLPVKPGIYLAIDSDDVVQYVGKAANLRARWCNHHRFDALLDMGDIRIVYLVTDSPASHVETEDALIEWFKPALNAVIRSDSQGTKSANSDKERVSVYLPEWLIAKLKVLAKQDDRSLNSLISFALKSEIRKWET